jgi:hypothetical protein
MKEAACEGCWGIFGSSKGVFYIHLALNELRIETELLNVDLGQEHVLQE